MSDSVRAVLTRWTRHEDRYGPHEAAEHLDDLREGIRGRLARLLGAPADGTALVTGAADAYADLVARLPLGPRDRVWTTPYESAAHLTTLFALRDRTRCVLEVVPLRPDGDLDLEWMAAHIDDDVALVSVSQVPAGCGIVNPVEEVGRLLAAHRCLYAVDASYAVGQLPVDVNRIGCDLLTGDGWRFLRGPVAVGFAHTSPRFRQAQQTRPAQQDRRRDAGGLPPLGPSAAPQHAAVLAFGTALAEHLAASAPPSGTAGQATAARLRAAVAEMPGVEPIDPGRIRSGIVAFRHDGLPAARVRGELAERGVVVWKTVGQEMPLYLPARGVTTAVRASVHLDNPAEDVERFADALREVLAGPRRHRSARFPHAGALTAQAPAGSFAAETPAGARAAKAPRGAAAAVVPAAGTGGTAVRAPAARQLPHPRRTEGRRHLALVAADPPA